MGHGYLQVEVRDYNGALPLSGAQVTISNQSAETLYQLTTNNEGTTEYVSLYAPDLTGETYPGHIAYATYTVSITAPGFVSQTIIGAEVFDGISSTQPISLKPLIDSAPDTEEIITVTPNSLVTGDQQQQKGPTDDFPPANDAPQQKSGVSIMPLTLKEVVIPEKITVHMGTPSASAKKISVPFPSYIKNVASGEIYPYPIWPQATIEANIYCIISLSLNRIYTEWYRSQGYNFDITNSTAFDQHYQEGQTIPDTISQTVDRLFSHYIRKIGRKEPLFSSYCNGTTATCASLSQWGSKSLGDRNMNPFQILQSYYGETIEITSTNIISGVLTSYPGYVLQNGSSGTPVAHMQNSLNRIRTNYPAIPQVIPDGRYGPGTTGSVKIFQSIFTLPQTGAINQATWNKISYIYLAVTRLAELTREGEQIGAGATPPTSFIQQDSSGADVAQLQFLLTAIGGYYEVITPVIQDSFFGTSTLDAVKAFQRQFGLTADGTVSPVTWNKLYQVYKSLPGINGSNRNNNSDSAINKSGDDISTPAYPGTLLKISSSGSNVALMQRYQNALTSKYPSIPKITEDGLFGPTSEAQAKAFQRQFNLQPVDGIIGPVTWATIVSAYNELGVLPVTGTALKLGSSGESVLLLQTHINRLADHNASVPHLATDGILGPATEAAIKATQHALGLTVDGIAGRVTWSTLIG